MEDGKPLVRTLLEKCRMCYTCIRDCPAKAIRVANGQAEVVTERCIGCGNCIKVCSQNAKIYYNSIQSVKDLLNNPEIKTLAMLAPSFPAAFQNIHHNLLIGKLKKIGFDHVCEVALGAEIVAYEYRKLIEKHPDKWYIATTCPGVVRFVEKYRHDLVKYLAPIVSPMIASARIFHHFYGKDIRIVFIGPCLAKKEEAFLNSTGSSPESCVSSVLTFEEIQLMFDELIPENAIIEEKDFDPPAASFGGIFPLQGGMLQVADIKRDLIYSNIRLADGKEDFVNAINEISSNPTGAGLLEVLCCKGCIMGAGIKNKSSYFSRMETVSKYVKKHIEKIGITDNKKLYEELQKNNVSIKSNFEARPVQTNSPSSKEIEHILKKMGKRKPEDELNCSACGYATCREHAKAIHMGLAENEMCLPNTIDRLNHSIEDLHVSRKKLYKVQEALFNAEKLASMGQLSAGIAHEINNPLGAILLNAKLLLEEIQDENLNKEYKEDLELIVQEAERCKSIVSGLLNFARKNKLILAPVNVVTLINNTLKTISKPDRITINVQSTMENQVAEIHGDKLMQVIINLVLNAIDAISGKGHIEITLSDTINDFTIKVKDDGSGIPKGHIDKIFEPLFTTKQLGKGTGLGLAVTYGIIKMHDGSITVISNADPEKGTTGTEFTIIIPRTDRQ